MPLKLTSVIQIGKYLLKGGVNEVNIKKSVDVIVDIASVSLPAIGRVNNNNQLPMSSIETATLFREGDKVTIDLGYNGELKREFTGFVRRVNLSRPVLIEMEGYAWQLRKKSIKGSFKTITLRSLLEKVIEGTDITLSKSIPETTLTKLTIANQSGLEVLQYLKEKLLLTVYFNGSELYVGLEEGLIKNEVKFRLGWNVIRDSELKYRIAEDNKVRVRIVKKLTKGEQVLYETGDEDGQIVKRTVPNWQEVDKLKIIAQKVLNEKKFTGYEGQIKCFLQPYCEPGDVAVILDPKYNKRDGKHFIASTEVKFGVKTKGARRMVEVTRRLN